MNFFSIVTVTYNDDWALSKTLKSIFSQLFNGYELIVVDGMSEDATESIVSFWVNENLVTRYIREPDTGVYDAMNKGASAANGSYVLYMNAGDVFFSNDVLQSVYDQIQVNPCDAIMGWGELNNQLWASWVVSEAFQMASLGFCHQSLYLKREICLKFPFDTRQHKTDSDIMQLASVIRNYNLILYPEVLAIRNGDVGISANLAKTKVSIIDSISASYSDLKQEEIASILLFRRTCSNFLQIFSLLKSLKGDTQEHLAILVMDTIFLSQSKSLNDVSVSKLMDLSIDIIRINDRYDCNVLIKNLLNTQRLRIDFATSLKVTKASMAKEIQALRIECNNKFGALPTGELNNSYTVALTSFPKRISSVHLVIESLLRQSCPPTRIILSLGADEFPNENWLPSQLRDLKSMGLVIHFVDNTAHQYDKYLHVYEENKTKPFVIVDDDVIYPPLSMEYLLNKHREYPKHVVANRAHKMRLNEKGELYPYAQWDKEVCEKQPQHNIFPTGAGGVLYPIGFFEKELVCNKKLLMKVAPYADDVWLKACSISKGIPAVCSEMLNKERWYYRYTPQMNEGALHKSNVDLGLNDMQLASTFGFLNVYPHQTQDKFWM